MVMIVLEEAKHLPEIEFADHVERVPGDNVISLPARENIFGVPLTFGGSALGQ